MRWLHFIALWLLAALPVSAALDVRNPRWGFGGKAVLGTFNILSVEVRNSGKELAQAELKLTEDGGGASSAAYVQAITLSPGQSRWVQFSIYLGNYKPGFVIAWGDHEEESLLIEDARGERNAGPPAVVVLADPNTVRTSHFPVFPEDMFPASVSATDGLHAVLLDHQPPFRAPQTEAFLDWVRLGGIVHVVTNSGGTTPMFEGKFTELNSAGPIARVGSGWVVKHSRTVAEMLPAHLEAAGFSSPVEALPDLERLSDWNLRNRAEPSSDLTFFEALATVTRPKLAWWLIFFLTVVYVAIIGPVFFILRKRDYRLLLLGFLATVLLFSWLFTVVGRRGYGESQVCHSLAVARVLGGGRYDVTHWSHAFATIGNTYHFSYPGSSQFYAAAARFGEKARGTIHLGGEASYEADIPLFSFRNFLHRGVMTGDDVGATLESVPPVDPSRHYEQWREGLKLTLASEVPGEVLSAAVQVGRYFLPAEISGKDVKIRGYSSGSGVTVLRYTGEDGDPESALQNLRRRGAELAERALGDSSSVPRGFGRAPGKETLRLYIYTAAPRAFRMAGTEFATGKNFVLYVQDFAIPAGSSAP